MKFRHTAVWISDLERTREFYCDGLGFEHTRDFTNHGVLNYFVSDGDAGIQFKYDPEGNTGISPSGFDHFSLDVDDVESTFSRLVDGYGAGIVEPPRELDSKGSMIAFVSDPDGYTVELIRRV